MPCHHRARIREHRGVVVRDKPPGASQIHELTGVEDLRHQRERVRRQVHREHRYLTIEPKERPREGLGWDALAHDCEGNDSGARRVLAAGETRHQILVLEDEHGSRSVTHKRGGDPIVILAEPRGAVEVTAGIANWRHEANGWRERESTLDVRWIMKVVDQ